MSILYKAYLDDNGEITLYEEGSTEDVAAGTNVQLTRVPANDTITSDDGTTNETPLTPTQQADAPVTSVGGEIGDITLEDLNLDNVDNTSDVDKPISNATQTAIDGKYDASNPNGYETPTELNTRDNDNRDRANHTGTQPSSTINDFDSSVDGRINIQKASNNGLATLDGTGKIPAVQLPAYVDDVLEFPNLASFPTTGESGKIYVALDTNKQYRWSGSTYIDLTGTVITQHSQLSLDDGSNPHGTTSNDVGLGNVDNTSDTNKPVSTAQQTALDLKANISSLGAVATSNDYNDLSNTPTIPPVAPVDSVNGETGAVVLDKTDIGLPNVDNTSDINKPVSTATQTAINNEATTRSNADNTLQTNIDSEATTRSNADANLQTQIDNLGGGVVNINDLGDVNTAGGQNGDTLTLQSGVWGPQTITNGFTIFPIWAEENGGLANGALEWSWGNGATGNIGISLGLDCELFAVSFNAETFGTSVSIDTRINGVAIETSNFTSNNQVVDVAPIQITKGSRLDFRTNVRVGNTTDARVCAWLRVKSTITLPSIDRQVIGATNLSFTAGSFIDVPTLTRDVILTSTGTITGDVIYSAVRSGGANAEFNIRIVIDGDNGRVFNDTLSTFNDTGIASHFVENLPAGTYTVKVQAQTTNAITLSSINLTATALES